MGEQLAAVVGVGQTHHRSSRKDVSMAGLVRPTVESSLNGPIGPHRRWDWARTTLSDIKRIRTELATAAEAFGVAQPGDVYALAHQRDNVPEIAPIVAA